MVLEDLTFVIAAFGMAFAITGLLKGIISGSRRTTGTLSIGDSGISATGPIWFLLIVLGVALMIIAWALGTAS